VRAQRLSSHRQLAPFLAGTLSSLFVRATRVNGTVGSFIERSWSVASHGNLDPSLTAPVQQQKRLFGGGPLTLHVCYVYVVQKSRKSRRRALETLRGSPPSGRSAGAATLPRRFSSSRARPPLMRMKRSLGSRVLQCRAKASLSCAAGPESYLCW
jgi:hypothetical protein